MSEQKRYTAQEIERIVEHLEKDENDSIWEVYIVNDSPVGLRTSDVVAMLRQAVDADDELKLALVTIGNQSDEIAQLKARLDAVVKIASDNLWCEDSGVVETDTCAKLHNSYMSDILRAARGEGGAE